jgi:hypothetical protein
MAAITTTGSDGSATGTGTTNAPLSGRLVAIHLDYSATQATTTDVTVTTLTAPIVTLFTRSNSATDGWFYPRQAVQDATGTAVYYNDAGDAPIYDAVTINDHVKVTVAQGDNTETVTVSLVIE